jgi:hypothetical protein
LRGALPPIHKVTPEGFQEIESNFKSVLDNNIELKINKAKDDPAAIENQYWDELSFLNTRKDQIWNSMSP